MWRLSPDLSLWLQEAKVPENHPQLTWERQSLWQGEEPCCSKHTGKLLSACPGSPPPSTARSPRPRGDVLSALGSGQLMGGLQLQLRPSKASVGSHPQPGVKVTKNKNPDYLYVYVQMITEDKISVCLSDFSLRAFVFPYQSLLLLLLLLLY